MGWDAGGDGATAWTLLPAARKLLSNIVSKRRGPARGGWLIHPMEMLAPWAGGQGGPSFQEGLGQEARQEGAGSFWKGSLERPGRAALGLTTHCSWLLSEMGNPWHFLAHARDEGGREGRRFWARGQDGGGGPLLSRPPGGMAVDREEKGGGLTGQ